jgi:hypothetical protein
VLRPPIDGTFRDTRGGRGASLLAMVQDPANVARYLAAVGEATEVPPRSPGRGPPYWKGCVLRLQASCDGDDGQGRWVRETA